MIRLFLKEIADEYIRKNFEFLQVAFRDFPLYRGRFKFFEINFGEARTNFKFTHLLGFVPKDLIVTSVIGPGVVTWNYSLFDTRDLDITVTGACTIRVFIGSYEEGSQA